MKIDIEIEGVQQALENIKKLDRNARRRGVTRSVNKAARPMVKRARLKSLPRRTGALWRAIRRTSTRVDWQRGTVTAKVAAKSTRGQRKKGLDAFYAHMVAGGTRRHQISVATTSGRGRNKRNIANPKRALSDGRQIFGRTVNHPGYQGRDFFRQAFGSGSRESIRVFGGSFGHEIEQEAAKLPT